MIELKARMIDKSTRDEQANAAAREIIELEKKKHDVKPARLRKARLAKEAADLLACAPGKPRARAVKAKQGKSA
jgi:hypothetical protein